MRAALLDAIAKRVLLGDGAMGTQLQAAGLAPGSCGEVWNLEHPDRVGAIHRAYVDAGSDCIITNTFCGCAIALERHGLSDRVRAINEAGVRVAREALAGRSGFVLGDIGPFGGFIEPIGETPEALVRDAFREQAEALVGAGCDAIIIETQVALEELTVAIGAARAAEAPCVIASLAFDPTRSGEDLRTIMGVTPEQAAVAARDAGADVIALNCGTGMDMAAAARCVKRYRAACDLPVMAQPNAGSPVMVDGKLMYLQTPELMANDMPLLLEAGARIIGACCGSTPAHIAKLRPLVDAFNVKR